MAVFTVKTDYSCENGYPFDNSRQIGNILGRTSGGVASTGGGGGGHPPPPPPPPCNKLFLSFFLEDKTSAPDVFSICSFIPREDLATSLVMVSFHGYEIWRHK